MTVTATSSFMNDNYLMSNFVPTTTNSEGDVLIDIFNFNALSAINAISIVGAATYVAGQKLPCIAKAQTGTTSTYWMIAVASGVMHPYKLEGGDPLYIPSADLMKFSTSVGTGNSTQNTYNTQTI